MQRWIGFFVASLISLSAGLSARADSPLPVSLGVATDLFAPIPIENEAPDGDRLRLRSIEGTAETRFNSEAPHVLGRLTLGANDVNGDLTINVREAFLQAFDVLPHLHVRAGKFFLPIGILNQTRQSAWPFISGPLFYGKFFNENGVVDTGFDFAGEFFNALQIRVGLTNGYRYDSAILNGGTKPMTPTHFARLSYDFDVGESVLTAAANYLGRVEASGDSMRMSGLDVSYAPKLLSPYDWRAQGEVFDRGVRPSGLQITEDLGAYVYLEKGLGSWAAGLRTDYYQIRSLTDASGNYRPNMTIAFTPVLSTHFRDHFALQGAYSYLRETREGDSMHSEQKIELRLVTEFGDIPKVRTPIRDQSSL